MIAAILTSALRVDHFLPYPTFTWETTHSLHDTFALTWSFSADTGTLLINNRTSLKLHLEQQKFRTVKDVATVFPNDNSITLPWFNMADATLLTTSIIPVSVALPLQLVRRLAAAGDAPTYDVFASPIHTSRSHPQLLPPLLTITYPSPATTSTIPSFLFPPLPYSASPSATLPVRRAIIYCITPVAFVVMLAVGVVYAVAKGVFWVLIFWLLVAVALWLSENWRGGDVERVPRGEPTHQSEVRVDDSKESEVVPGSIGSMV